MKARLSWDHSGRTSSIDKIENEKVLIGIFAGAGNQGRPACMVVNLP